MSSCSFSLPVRRETSLGVKRGLSWMTKPVGAVLFIGKEKNPSRTSGHQPSAVDVSLVTVDVSTVPMQVSAMLPLWSFPYWTSTTLWFWLGACTTCSSPSVLNFPGPAAITHGTLKTVYRIHSARTWAIGGLPMLPTLHHQSLSSGSKLHATRLFFHRFVLR